MTLCSFTHQLTKGSHVFTCLQEIRKDLQPIFFTVQVVMFRLEHLVSLFAELLQCLGLDATSFQVLLHPRKTNAALVVIDLLAVEFMATPHANKGFCDRFVPWTCDSNTEKWANPIYRMTSRKEGDLEANMGKFQQYWLEEVEVSEARDEAASLLPTKKQAIWYYLVSQS